jgi:uncharacterized membrane-anchored protein YhcB (DUF1043 family)
MAEIRIQKKKPPVWPWILIIAAVIIAAYLLIENTRVDEEIAGGMKDDRDNIESETERDYSDPQSDRSSEIVNDYLLFINNQQPGSEQGDYISGGMQKLTSAISAIADEKFSGDADINDKADRLQERTNNLNSDNDSRSFKQIADNSVNVLNDMQQKKNKNIDNKISDARKSLDKINSSQPAENQQEEIENFFKESGEVLQILAADDENINRN